MNRAGDGDAVTAAAMHLDLSPVFARAAELEGEARRRYLLEIASRVLCDIGADAAPLDALDAIRRELTGQRPRDWLGEALNMGDGSYRP